MAKRKTRFTSNMTRLINKLDPEKTETPSINLQDVAYLLSLTETYHKSALGESLYAALKFNGHANSSIRPISLVTKSLRNWITRNNG